MSCDQSEIYAKNLFRNDLGSRKEFYSPLSKTGYLTPLQRRKLREKRRLDLCDFPQDSKAPKRIKNMSSGKNDKKKENIKCSAWKVQCRISAVSKNAENNKSKKFFKTSTSRCTNANFTVPFVFTKPLTKFDKNIKFLYGSQNTTSKNNKILNSFKSCLESMTNSSNSFDDKLSTLHCKNCGSGPSKHCTTFDFELPAAADLLQRQKKARLLYRENIQTELNAASLNLDECSSQNALPVKLYPIFEFSKKNLLCFSSVERNNKCVMKIWKSSKGAEQMIIDAGQQEIGPKVCNTCDMLYNVGQEEDEKLHSSYHTMFLSNLKFPGWKEENVVREYWDGRVIMVQQNDQCYKLKKIEDVLLIANRDLGFPASGLPFKPDMTFILFISSEKHVAGCVVAEPVSSGNKVLSKNNTIQSPNQKCENWYSSCESSPAICGVNRIWVSKKYRRCKVASRMLDCLRCNFIHGHVVSLQEIAFTDPSTDGREFAASYTGTNNFLVYK